MLIIGMIIHNSGDPYQGIGPSLYSLNTFLFKKYIRPNNPNARRFTNKPNSNIWKSSQAVIRIENVNSLQSFRSELLLSFLKINHANFLEVCQII